MLDLPRKYMRAEYIIKNVQRRNTRKSNLNSIIRKSVRLRYEKGGKMHSVQTRDKLRKIKRNKSHDP